MKPSVLFCFGVVCLRTAATRKCPVCDPNDYNPVCASGKAFKSSCYLMRQGCLGNVVLASNVYGQCRKKTIVTPRRYEKSRHLNPKSASEVAESGHNTPTPVTEVASQNSPLEVAPRNLESEVATGNLDSKMVPPDTEVLQCYYKHILRIPPKGSLHPIKRLFFLESFCSELTNL